MVDVALLALLDDHGFGLMGGQLERAVEQRLVLDHAAGLDAARRRHDHLRRGVVDADRQLVCCEAAEDDRVHRADAGQANIATTASGIIGM